VKRILLLFGLFGLFVFIPALVLPRDAPPIVSTDWLEQNSKRPGLVVLDIRSLEQYKKGHIPGALHAPFSAWAVGNDGLSLELPSDDALRVLLGGLGISRDSTVLVVGRGDTHYARADATRVAWTCMLAGVKTVSVLDGGHLSGQRKAGRSPATSQSPRPRPIRAP
jgi:thiosulfate/3-mercaptopyruvate sulfurtransferase